LEKYRPGDGSTTQSAAANSPTMDDWLSSSCWQTMLTHLLEQGYVVKQIGHKKFSVGKKLLPFVKALYPTAPFVVDTNGVSINGNPASKPWRESAFKAIKVVFSFQAFHEDKHGLGKCIPDYYLIDDDQTSDQLAQTTVPYQLSSQTTQATAPVSKRQRTGGASSSSTALVLYLPTGNLTDDMCTALAEVLPRTHLKCPELVLSFLAKMPADQINDWLVQLRQATTPAEAEKMLKGWNDDYHRELKKNGSETLQKNEAAFRKAKREVDATTLRLQNSKKYAELEDERNKASAQHKELKKQGYGDPGAHELCSTLQEAIDAADARLWELRVKGKKFEAEAWVKRLEVASVVWDQPW